MTAFAAAGCHGEHDGCGHCRCGPSSCHTAGDTRADHLAGGTAARSHRDCSKGCTTRAEGAIPISERHSEYVRALDLATLPMMHHVPGFAVMTRACGSYRRTLTLRWMAGQRRAVLVSACSRALPWCATLMLLCWRGNVNLAPRFCTNILMHWCWPSHCNWCQFCHDAAHWPRNVATLCRWLRRAPGWRQAIPTARRPRCSSCVPGTDCASCGAAACARCCPACASTSAAPSGPTSRKPPPG